MPQKRRRDSPLSLLQINFAKEYFANGGNVTDACRIMGISRTTVQHWFEDHLQFIAYVEEHREKLKKATQYDLQAAIRELDEAIIFARETENANALVKALELKMKGHGLLIEKHDVRTFAAFSIKISGIDDPIPLSAADVKVLAPGGNLVDPQDSAPVEALDFTSGQEDDSDEELDEDRMWT